MLVGLFYALFVCQRRHLLQQLAVVLAHLHDVVQYIAVGRVFEDGFAQGECVVEAVFRDGLFGFGVYLYESFLFHGAYEGVIP